MHDISKVYIKNIEKTKRIHEDFFYITENKSIRLLLRNWEIIKTKNKNKGSRINANKEYWKKFL
jgi:hypothetical protein